MTNVFRGCFTCLKPTHFYEKKLLCTINKQAIKVKKALKKMTTFRTPRGHISTSSFLSLTSYSHKNVFSGVIYTIIKVLKTARFSFNMRFIYMCVHQSTQMCYKVFFISIVVSCFSSNCEMSVLISESNKVVVLTAEKIS